MEKPVCLRKERKKEKTVTEEQIQTALFAGLALLVLAFPAAKYIWIYHIRANQIQEVFLIGLTVYFLLVLGLAYRNRPLPVKNISAIALTGMVAFGLISSLWNGDLENSIYGGEFEGEGLITLVSYYMIFFAAAHLKKKEYRRWLFRFLCMELAFVAAYGIMQFFQVPFMIHALNKAAILPTRNQNFYAALPVLFLGFVFGKILYGGETSEGTGKYSGAQSVPVTGRRLPIVPEKRMIFWHILAMLGYGACISADSLVAYLGLGMQFVLLFFLACFRKQKHFSTLLLLLAEFFAVFIVFDLCSGGQAVEEVLSLFFQIQKEGSLLGDSVGTGRMRIWKETLKLISEKPLLGCGIECYSIQYTVEEKLYFCSNAHNEYLQIWAEQGIFCIASYLLFLFSLFIPGLLQFIKKDRYDSDPVSKAAMFAFFGYIAQAFANIRVLQVAPYFWLCCGLLYVRRREQHKK